VTTGASATGVDVAALQAWLRLAVPQLKVAANSVVTATRIGGGYSNLTFDIAITDDGGTRHLILRRPPVGVRADRGAHDMRREFRVLSAVHGSAVPVPAPIALCEDESVLGGMFFLMSLVEGVAVRTLRDLPALRDPVVMRAMSESCVDALAALHGMQAPAAMVDPARVATYGSRQIQSWGERWAAAQTDDVSGVDATRVFAWLAVQLPAPVSPALLHNDWKFDNLLLDATDPTVINGVLDWEMATVGDPRFDLATTLGYWVQANDPPALQAMALGVTNAPGCLTRAEVVARYASQRGVVIEQPVYWWVFGQAKVAVIVLQLYARYMRGGTSDARFAALGSMAELLMRSAQSAITRNSLDPDVAH
jgi:aminoglycoside phosphotransferase (APT) family kinase protein